MPRVEAGFPLITAFNPRRRAKALPRFDRRLAFQAAHNLAQIVGDLHAGGYVVGDLNESNALVTENARISLIDIDSFQVRIPTAGNVVTYRSLVGKPEYTPPELQGVNFRSVDRLYEHDRFALGVLIFQLLMEGNHPFSVRWQGRGDPRLWSEPFGRECIHSHPRRIRSRFRRVHRESRRLMQQPRICFGSALSRDVPALTLDQPATRGPVPAAAEKALAKCRKGHRYATHLMTCPYCHASQNWTRKRASFALQASARRQARRRRRLEGWPRRHLRQCGVRAAQRKSSPVPSLATESSNTGSEGDTDLALGHLGHHCHPDHDVFIGGR